MRFMKIWKFLLLILLAILPGALPAQVTFYQHIQPVLQKNCGSCHHPQGAAPFSLLSYPDVVKRASFVLDVIESGYMPPYPADPAFAKHANVQHVTSEEISLIRNWVSQGKKEGMPPASETVSEPNSLPQPKPDLVLKRSTPYIIPGNNKELFKIFVLPVALPDTAYLSAIEYVPGNARRSHHSRIMLDTSGKLRADDGIDVGDSSELGKAGITIYDEFWKGWVPGNSRAAFYPPGMAKALPPRTDLIINTHYAAGPLDEEDDFSVRLFYSPEKPRRLVRNFILAEQHIRNGPFYLPPDTVMTFYMQSQPLPFSVSVLSVLPHMHQLGKSFKAFAITPAGDVIPLVSIPVWRFNWQLTYAFPSLLKIPEGSIIYVQATYDNTAGNPLNPNTPPKAVKNGWGVKDEMLNFIIEYVEYEEGDEKIPVQTHFAPF